MGREPRAFNPNVSQLHTPNFDEIVTSGSFGRDAFSLLGINLRLRVEHA